MNDFKKNYGPLFPLIGTWESTLGHDLAPSDDRKGEEHNRYRELLTFETMPAIKNHEQTLYGLRYRTMAWELGKGPDPFHEELGYWLWDAQREEVIRCFMVPRGVNVMASGKTSATARDFTLSAELGSRTNGICSQPFLDQEFQTLRYQLKLQIHHERSFSYDEVTFLRIKGQEKIFEHRDKNTLSKKT